MYIIDPGYVSLRVNKNCFAVDSRTPISKWKSDSKIKPAMHVTV